jgi:hypothetical protein
MWENPEVDYKVNFRNSEHRNEHQHTVFELGEGGFMSLAILPVHSFPLLIVMSEHRRDQLISSYDPLIEYLVWISGAAPTVRNDVSRSILIGIMY